MTLAPRPASYQPNPRIPIILFLVFLLTAVLIGAVAGPILFLNFIYIGLMVSLGQYLMDHLPKKKWLNGRRLSQFGVGIYMLAFLGLFARENMQLEGFWFVLFSGAFSGAVVHYTVSKIVGPLVIGRSWCGMACWTGMILDVLPFKRSPGRYPGWGWLRYAHFALSFALIAFLWFGLSYQPEQGFNLQLLIWFAAGNLFYYGTAIGLAYALKDNRAFCKYVCPVTVPLKLGARFSLLRVHADPAACNDCKACEKLCPMDVPLTDYIQHNQRIASDECILCQTCVHTCAKGALGLTFDLDAAPQYPLRRPAK